MPLYRVTFIQFRFVILFSYMLINKLKKVGYLLNNGATVFADDYFREKKCLISPLYQPLS